MWKLYWGFLGSILYIHSVVGGFINCTGVIYGVRTSLFLASQRMPSRYGRVHTHIQSNKSSLLKMFIGDIFDSIFYRYSVVGGVVNFIDDIYGGTLPVLKNEIIDFFFARLGTGSTSLFLTSKRMPSRYVAYRCIYNYKNIIIYGCEVENIYKCVHAAKMENVERMFWGEIFNKHIGGCML